ncbi:MAG: DNA-protecting protein DprA, partial [Gammaproteobacteria bacterium]
MRELFELYWLRIPGVGARHLRVLGDLATAPTIDEAFHALRSRIRGDSSELDAFAPRTRWGREALAAARGDLDWLAANDVTILRPRDADFPPLLNEIPDPPPLLFVQGRPGTLHAHQVAIVGSRRASLGGREVARSLAQELARIGMVTTSGLARGIDVAAHRGALHGAGATVAVLGSGLRRVYPRENVRTSEEIRESGCLVTEFPPAMTPRPEHFPRRNRIISGLSLGVVVVEAA